MTVIGTNMPSMAISYGDMYISEVNTLRLSADEELLTGHEDEIIRFIPYPNHKLTG